MLADRYYMRGGGYRNQQPFTVWLMIVLVIVFAIQCINDIYARTPLEQWLALTGSGLQRGFLWQLLTFQLLHGGIIHLLCNLIGLWFFGMFVERVLGWRRFLFAYFGCGVIGGLLQGILMLLFPMHFGFAVYGASAGVSGMFAIFARLEAESDVRWNFLFTIRAKTLLLFYICFELFFTLVPSARGGSVAHAAHLGGILAGLGFVALGWHRDFVQLPWMEWLSRFWSRREPKRQKRAAWFEELVSQQNRTKATLEESDASFISKNVDPILDKISAHGIHSLTEQERKTLETARRKMAGR